MACRSHCGACCIAPSISSPIPGMPNGKKAGEPCIHLNEEMKCLIFSSKDRPACCGGLQPTKEMCGDTREQALRFLGILEADTIPVKLSI
ncbi:YkgJ family cysteine cluster protein [Thorsellia kenyensis]|uniref:YkgJ family cysteine cluster protein n=1 Tax=Thorsellia kenyensis TaxID=1549888 RepID=A0ABV6C6H3_9GAMM